MIKLNSLDEEVLIKLISGIFKKPTTKDTYLYINEVLNLLPVDETVKEFYCIFSAFENLYEIYSIRGSIPTINKEVILNIVCNNLYGELKENTNVGFEEFAQMYCNISIDVFNEQSIALVYQRMKEKVETILDNIEILDYTIEDSQSSIPIFLENFSYCLATETSAIISLFNSSDTKVLKYQYWGWSRFLFKHKIRSILDFSTLIRLVASHHDNKVYLSNKETRPLTSVQQIIALEEEYVKADIPLGYWESDPMNELVRLTPHQVTVLVGQRGVGKTTLGGYLAGNLIAQNKKVLFYCPEIMPHQLLFIFVLPSYIKAKYGFMVTPQQCLGLEPPYEYGSDLTSDEKKEIIKLSKLEFAESKNFYHSDRHYSVNTVSEELRSKIIEFQPDFIIFDHTLELRNENNYNVLTQVLADAFEEIKKDFPVHILALSHTGSEFKIPTKDNPIVTSKIVAWSKRMEGVADNIVGMFESKGCVNLFFTKLRWASLIPMYLVFRMDKIHSLFTFRSEDQLNVKVDEEELKRLIALTSGNAVFDVYGEDDEEEDGDDYTIPKE